MVRKQIAAAVLALSVTGGIGTGFAAHAWDKDDKPTTTTAQQPKASDKPTTTPTLTPVPSVADFELAPGVLGPVRAGMTKQEALATGLFDADVKSGACDFTAPLKWKSVYEGAFDVLTLGNGEINAIGVMSGGPRTSTGLGIGSTYAQVSAVYRGAEQRDNDYGQAGILAADAMTGGWLGFLFDKSIDQVKSSDKVVFIEVTKGAKPGLLRDGC